MLIESLIAHILGDFYFQSQEMADQKRTNNKILFSHFENYGWASVLFFLVVITLNRGFTLNEWLVTLLLVISGHAAVDYFLKPVLDQTIHSLSVSTDKPNFVTIHSKNQNTLVFILDQLLHLLVIILINWIVPVLPILLHWLLITILLLGISLFLVKIYREQNVMNALKQLILLFVCFHGSTFLFIAVVDFMIFNQFEVNFFSFFYLSSLEYNSLTSMFLTLLLLFKPINIVIRIISSNFDPKGFQTVESVKIDQIDLENQENSIPGFKGAGAMIGNLERLLILLALFSGELLPVVAILSIKAFARYKLIVEDASFAEYFVIGTMLSVLLTLGCYILIQTLLLV